MKVQCPNCGAIGRVPDNRIPTEGANIRCPTCAFVFFVGGPKQNNVVVDSAETGSIGSLPAMGQTQSLPAADPSALRAPRSGADTTEAHTARSSSTAGPGQTLSTRVGSGAHSAVSSSPADHGVAAVAASAVPATAPSADASAGSAAGGEHRTLRKLVVSGSEIVTDSSLPDARPSAPLGAGAADSSTTLDSGNYEASVQAILAGNDWEETSTGAPSSSPSARSATRPATDASSTEPVRDSAAPSPPDAAAYASEPRRPPQSATGGPPVPAIPKSAASSHDVRSSGSVSDPAGQGSRAKAVQLFKIRAKSGIVYDFHDEQAVRKWLVTRGTFDDLQYSDDGGFLFRSVLEVDHLSDLTPGGLKTRVGSPPAITADVVAARKLTESVESRPMRPPESASVPAAGRHTGSHTAAAAAASNTGRRQPGRIPAWRAGLYVALVAIAALVAVITFAPRPTGPRIPNTPAGEQLRWMLDTIRGNSAALNTTSVTAKLVPDLHAQAEEFLQRLQWLDDWRETFELTSIPVSAENRIVAQMVTEGQDTGWVLILTEEAPPHRIVDLQFGRGNPSPQILQR